MLIDGREGSLMVERESPKFLVWVRIPPFLFKVSVAQSVERATVNREVVGSSPIRDET